MLGALAYRTDDSSLADLVLEGPFRLDRLRTTGVVLMYLSIRSPEDVEHHLDKVRQAATFARWGNADLVRTCIKRLRIWIGAGHRPSEVILWSLRIYLSPVKGFRDRTLARVEPWI